jgi:hypothetical protein
MGKHSGKRFQKSFRKPWSSIYSTEMFSKGFLGQMKTGFERKEVGCFLRKDIGDYVFTRGNLIRATTLPLYGIGLSSKFICLSAGSLALYKGLQDPGIRVATKSLAIVNWYPLGFIRPEDTWVSPAGALELRSTEVDGQGLPGMYTPQGRRPY